MSAEREPTIEAVSGSVDPEALAVRPEGSMDFLSVLAQAVRDPRVDVAKMERLLEMQRQVTEDQRRVAFAAAMARLQAVLPQISKEGRIIVSGAERSRYARIEDIDVAVRPLLAAEGFSLSFDTETVDGKAFVVTAKLSHKDGHAESKTLTLPVDEMQSRDGRLLRSAVQNVGSTVSYARRQLIKMHLNLIERGEDDDGQGGSDPITPAQVADLTALLTEVGADEARFLSFMQVAKLQDIRARDHKKAVTALETKRRGAK